MKKNYLAILLIIVIFPIITDKISSSESYITSYDPVLGGDATHSILIKYAIDCIGSDRYNHPNIEFRYALDRLYIELSNPNLVKKLNMSQDFEDGDIWRDGSERNANRKGVHHGWNPDTEKGPIGGGSNIGAPHFAEKYFKKAINLYMDEKNKEEAYFELGRVIHVIQDLTVPYHAMNERYGYKFQPHTITGGNIPQYTGKDYNHHTTYENFVNLYLDTSSARFHTWDCYLDEFGNAEYVFPIDQSAIGYYVPPNDYNDDTYNDLNGVNYIGIKDYVQKAAIYGHQSYKSMVYKNGVDASNGYLEPAYKWIPYPFSAIYLAYYNAINEPESFPSAWREVGKNLINNAIGLTAGVLFYFYLIVTMDDTADVYDGVNAYDEWEEGTNPTSSDTDSDLIPDVWEIEYNIMNPSIMDTNQDYDNDDLTNYEEYLASTDPSKFDTDYDGISDSNEINGVFNSNNPFCGGLFTNLNPLSQDTDEDGLTDYAEIFTYLTNPKDNDSDDDSINDFDDLENSLSPNDSDSDGIIDEDELTYNTDYNNPDSDFDLVSDYDEIFVYGTNPLLGDTDEDGLMDGTEIHGLSYDENGDLIVIPFWSSSDPVEYDTDGDGLTNFEEINIYGTLYSEEDIDNDGLNDYQEIIIYKTNPWIKDTDGDGIFDNLEINIYMTDPIMYDTDLDGLSDGDELNIYFTDPFNEDTDSDNMDDWYEIVNSLNPFSDDTTNDYDGDTIINIFEYCNFTRSNLIDTDADGLTDAEEILGIYAPNNPASNLYGYIVSLDPTNYDEDGDMVSDKYEILFNTNPFDSTSYPSNVGYIEDNFANFGITLDDERITSTNTPLSIDYSYSNNNPENTKSYENYLLSLPVESNEFILEIDLDWKVQTTYPVWSILLDVGFYDSSTETFTRYASIGTRDSWTANYGYYRSFGYDTWHNSMNYNEVGNEKTNIRFRIIKDNEFLNCEVVNYLTQQILYTYSYSVIDFGINSIQLTYNHHDLYYFDISTCNIERFYGVFSTTPSTGDIDSDGITDFEESILGLDGFQTDPYLTDTDGDGWTDGFEVYTSITNPTSVDTDNDGIADKIEYDWYINNWGLSSTAAFNNIKDYDSDNDGLSDGYEKNLGTNPIDNDTDNDGLSDGNEINLGTNPFDIDTDDDDLLDGYEVYIGTNPLDYDTDNDGYTDGWEINNGYDPLDSNSNPDGYYWYE
ncbi:MAG: zinc dependent phospholipase C family protein [Candidatus Thorarchaeota archaeon]